MLLELNKKLCKKLKFLFSYSHQIIRFKINNNNFKFSKFKTGNLIALKINSLMLIKIKMIIIFNLEILFFKKKQNVLAVHNYNHKLILAVIIKMKNNLIKRMNIRKIKLKILK